MSLDYDHYLPTIDAILSVANLEEITVKKIRNALQELFTITFQDENKKKINEIILNRYYSLIDSRKDQDYDTKKKLKEIEKQDALLAARLSRSQKSKKIDKKTKTKKTKIDKKTSSSSSTSGFNKEHHLSPELSTVLGTSFLSRPQVVKQLWAYIKDNHLQNPNDMRVILCDDKLKKVFKKNTVGAFEMNKHLLNHIFKDDEVISKLDVASKHEVKGEEMEVKGEVRAKLEG